MKNRIKFHSIRARRHDDEPVVQNDLAVTPAQMMELTNKGFSITGQNLRMLEAADPADKDFYVPLQYRRGVDIADISEASQEVRKKMKKAVKDYDDGKIPSAKPPKDE